MIAPVVIATIVASQGWRASYLHTAILTLLLSVLWYVRVRDGLSHNEHIEDTGSAMERFVPNATLWLLTLSYAAVSFLSALFDNWIFYYFRDVRHFGPSASAWFTTAVQTSILLGLPIGGWLTDRLETIRRKRVFVIGVLSVSAISLMCASVAGHYTIAIILFLCCLWNIVGH